MKQTPSAERKGAGGAAVAAGAPARGGGLPNKKENGKDKSLFEGFEQGIGSFFFEICFKLVVYSGISPGNGTMGVAFDLQRLLHGCWYSSDYRIMSTSTQLKGTAQGLAQGGSPSGRAKGC